MSETFNVTTLQVKNLVPFDSRSIYDGSKVNNALILEEIENAASDIVAILESKGVSVDDIKNKGTYAAALRNIQRYVRRRAAVEVTRLVPGHQEWIEGKEDEVSDYEEQIRSYSHFVLGKAGGSQVHTNVDLNPSEEEEAKNQFIGRTLDWW